MSESQARVLTQAAASLALSLGWESAEPAVLSLLAHQLKLFIQETGASAKALAEQSGRAGIIPSDVSLALINRGVLPHVTLPAELSDAMVRRKVVVHPPRPSSACAQASAIRVGRTRPKSSHYPDFLPPFPDPHTYVYTPVAEDGERSHAEVREASAEATRAVDASLVQFLLRTTPNLKLYPDSGLPAILVPEPRSRPYLIPMLGDYPAQTEKVEVQRVEGENPYLAPPTMPAAPMDTTQEEDQGRTIHMD